MKQINFRVKCLPVSSPLVSSKFPNFQNTFSSLQFIEVYHFGPKLTRAYWILRDDYLACHMNTKVTCQIDILVFFSSSSFSFPSSFPFCHFFPTWMGRKTRKEKEKEKRKKMSQYRHATWASRRIPEESWRFRHFDKFGDMKICFESSSTWMTQANNFRDRNNTLYS